LPTEHNTKLNGEQELNQHNEHEPTLLVDRSRI
jgi:hypothetical protein